MRVGFFTKGFLQGRDYSDVSKGNPGVGGTEYMFWLVACELAAGDNDIEVHFFTDSHVVFPQAVHMHFAEDLHGALESVRGLGLAYLVVRGRLGEEDARTISQHDVPVISWAHDFETPSRCKVIARTDNIIANVCVGWEQYDRLRDHDVFAKSLVIPNCIDAGLYRRFERADRLDSKRVTFMGAIEPYKGFHVLARAWKGIARAFPEASLRVVGSGELYSGAGSRKLGRLGLAEEGYEKTFADALTDERGELLPSVELCGVLGGHEKLAAIADSAVGVVNPTAQPETFCIVAIEFAAVGVPVVAPAHYGLLDTVEDGKTGLMFSRERDLPGKIAALLRDNAMNMELGREAQRSVSARFDVPFIVGKWEKLFHGDIDHDMRLGARQVHLTRDHKWLREVNRRLKTIPPCGGLPSCIDYVDKVRKLLR